MFAWYLSSKVSTSIIHNAMKKMTKKDDSDHNVEHAHKSLSTSSSCNSKLYKNLNYCFYFFFFIKINPLRN